MPFYKGWQQDPQILAFTVAPDFLRSFSPASEAQ